MNILIRNFADKRNEELKSIINKEDLAIEIVCKAKVGPGYLISMINNLFKYIYNYNYLTAEDLGVNGEAVIIERKNINYVIYKKHLFNLSGKYSLKVKKNTLLFNDPENFVSIRLIEIL